MDDIVRAVSERTGLGDEQSRQAVDVAGHSKKRPAGPAGIIPDHALVGQDEGAPGQPSDMLGHATQAVEKFFPHGGT